MFGTDRIIAAMLLIHAAVLEPHDVSFPKIGREKSPGLKEKKMP